MTAPTHDHFGDDDECPCYLEGVKIGEGIGRQDTLEVIQQQNPHLFDEEGDLLLDGPRLN